MMSSFCREAVIANISPPTFYMENKVNCGLKNARLDDAPAQLTGTRPGFFLTFPAAVSVADGAFMASTMMAVVEEAPRSP